MFLKEATFAYQGCIYFKKKKKLKQKQKKTVKQCKNCNIVKYYFNLK